MGIRARIAFCASLAGILPQLTRLERSSAQEDGAGAAAAWLQVHGQPHPGTEGAGTRVPDDGGDALQPTPFAPAAPVKLRLWWVDAEATAVASFEAGASTLFTLPLSRAPPALS